jgi:hypothetical protein
LSGLYKGDLSEDQDLDFKFHSKNPATGAPATLSGTPVLSVYKDNSTTQTTTGPTLTVDFDSITGCNHVRLVTTDAFYTAGSDYQVVLTAGTVGGVSVVGTTVAEFSIENRFDDVNVVTVSGTAQTANDNGAGIITLLTRIVGTLASGTHNPQTGDSYAIVNNGTYGNAALDTDLGTLLTRIVGTLAAGTHNPASTAQLGALTDWLDGGRLDLLLDAIKAITDQFVFTTANQVDSNPIDRTGFSVSATGLDAVLFDSTFALAIARAIYTDTLTTYTDGMAGRRFLNLSELVDTEITVNDASATTASFITDKTGGADLSDLAMKFNDGTNAGQSRVVTTHNTVTGEMTFDEAWSAAPANGATAILGLHTHSVTSIKEAVRAEMDANSTKLAAIETDTQDLQTQVGIAGAGLTDLGGMSTGMKAEVNAEADLALTDYAPATEAKQDIIDSNVDAILVDTGTTLPGLIDDLAIKKNTTYSNFTFEMVLDSDHITPATGLTVTGQRSIDGGAYANVAGTISEIGNGSYKFDALAADTNGDNIIWRFSSATADDTKVHFKTVT